MRVSRAGGALSGLPPPLKNKNKAIGCLINTGPGPLNTPKGNKPAFNVDHHLSANEMPFKWRFAGGSMMAR